ncbi:MAG: hypothetical protein V3T23_09050 [Nitrososphaerales archaeon]
MTDVKQLIMDALKDLGAMDAANMFTEIRGELLDPTITADHVSDAMALLEDQGTLEIIGVKRNYRNPLFVVYDINR